MSTTFSYTTQTNSQAIVSTFDSIGAHLAAKLQSFSSDERTLTDELCDMSCIWNNQQIPTPALQNHRASNFPNASFRLSLGKVSSKKEKVNGADLKINILTPSGFKKALFQAKVVEPNTGQLRRNSKKDWLKLRSQLKKMRNRVGQTSFLLLYIPANDLSGRMQIYPTWEQVLINNASGNLNSRFGATCIPVDRLLDKKGQWKLPNKIEYHSNGNFNPSGFSFTRAVLELICCIRGEYQEEEGIQENDELEDFRSLNLKIDKLSQEEWEKLIGSIREKIG